MENYLRVNAIRLGETGGTGGGGAGAIHVPDNYFFADDTARDAYFSSSPAELQQGAYAVVAGVLQRYDGTAWKDMSTVVRGPQGNNIELQNDGTNISWRVLGEATWHLLAALDDLKGDKGDSGTDGRSPEFRFDSGYLQYRLAGDVAWINLIPASLLVGEKGDKGDRGEKGDKGDEGDTGKSAYQEWLDAGNSGPETDFLASLKGDKGDEGDTGKSAYQSWLDAGHTGTEQDFLDSITPVWGHVEGTLADQTDLSGALDEKLDRETDYGGGLKSRFFHENDGGGYLFEDGTNVYFIGMDLSNEDGSPGILLYAKNKNTGAGKRLKLTLNSGILANDGTAADVFLKVLKTSDIEDSLASTSVLLALSANMGRELAKRVDAANGSGGFLNPYDFGTDAPAQQELTDYAMTFIFGADVASHTPEEIFNGTKVQNLNDKRVWQLANTPNTSPAVFEWMPALVVSEAQRDFTASPVQTGEITDGAVTAVKLAEAIQTLLGYVDITGSLTTLLAGKQNTETGKGLSTNDFTDAYISLLNYMTGRNQVTTLTNVNVAAKQFTVATVSSNQALTLTGVPPANIAHILVKNGSAANITVAVPTTGAYRSRAGAAATVPVSGSIEFSILYDAADSVYIISMLENR